MHGMRASAATEIVLAGAIALAGFGAPQGAQAAPAVVHVPCQAAALAADVTSASSGEKLSLAPDCVYHLTAGLPAISQDLIITGNGATLERSYAPGTAAFNILEVDNGTVTVSKLNFRHGNGAIVVNGIGTVIVNGGTFSGNAADAGGAIFNNSALGGLTVNGATFTGNQATAGGAIFDNSAAGAVVTDSTFYRNKAVEGGAIVTDPNTGTSLTRVLIYSNYAQSGGGIYNIAFVGVTDSRISGNHAVSQGGGLFNADLNGNIGSVQLTGTIVQGNSAGDGAGIYNENGIMTIAGGKIWDNDARADGGAIYNELDPDDPVSELDLGTSEISGNAAGRSGGGLYNEGQAAATSTQIARNKAAASGGGIIDIDGATVTLTSSLVANNKPDNCEPANSITSCP
jgi:hypothetical protein